MVLCRQSGSTVINDFFLHRKDIIKNSFSACTNECKHCELAQNLSSPLHFVLKCKAKAIKTQTKKLYIFEILDIDLSLFGYLVENAYRSEYLS